MAINRLLKDDNKFALNYILLKSFEEVAAALDSADCSKDSGTTASVVLLRNEDLAIANVGDSSVLVLAQHQWRRTRTIRFESMNHRPSNADELERIKAAGGRTYGNYVVDEEAKNVR